jgi:hypothetical protein
MNTYSVAIERTIKLVDHIEIEANSKKDAIEQVQHSLSGGVGHAPAWFDEHSWGEVMYYCVDKAPFNPDQFKVIREDVVRVQD